RKSILFICLVLAVIPAVAQQEKSPTDTIALSNVMIIPYDERYYLSDADRDIMQVSTAMPDHFRKYFRFQVDRNVQRYVSLSYPCISLLNDTADELEETMYEILSKTGYRFEKVVPVEPAINRLLDMEIKLKKEGEKFADSKTASMYIPAKKDGMYMHAIVKDGEKLFRKMKNKYNVDYFVFLTQLEIKTNYSSCMDIAKKIYRREIMLHFTIYDAGGNVVAGSYATAHIPSDRNEASMISGQCFPELAKYIAACLP
ncbi:MAG: hypothetical protein ACKOYC_04180, partial [Bacteroidota bacterium]